MTGKCEEKRKNKTGTPSVATEDTDHLSVQRFPDRGFPVRTSPEISVAGVSSLRIPLCTRGSGLTVCCAIVNGRSKHRRGFFRAQHWDNFRPRLRIYTERPPALSKRATAVRVLPGRSPISLPGYLQRTSRDIRRGYSEIEFSELILFRSQIRFVSILWE